MTFFQAFLATAAIVCSAVSVQGDSLECPLVCPDLYSPTCGTDGTSYAQFDNDCLLSVFNCQRQRSALSAYVQTDIDWCTTTELDDLDQDLSVDLENADPSCFRPCAMIYNPVCGSNGTFRKQFSNECEMNLFNCVYKATAKRSWRILKAGKCTQGSDQQW